MFAISCSIVQTYDSLNVCDMLLPDVADAMQNERVLSPVSRFSLQNAENIVHTTTMQTLFFPACGLASFAKF